MANNPPVQPTPVPGPTAIAYYRLPDYPANAYQLLSNLADAIDTANAKLNGHANSLSDINRSTGNAVSNVISTSKGQATDTLSSLWGGSQTDMTNAHTQLAAMTTPSQGIGPGPNDFRSTLNENASAIQTGLLALENLQQHQNSSGLVPLTDQQMQQWKQDVDTLDSSLMNVNMAIEILVMAINNLNQGFAAVCATGLTPGGPLPLFTNNVFANQIHDGAPGSGNENNPEVRIENLLNDDTKATVLMVDALNAGVDLNTIANLLEKGESFDSIKQALTDAQTLEEKGISNKAVNILFQMKGDTNGSISDVTALLDQGVNSNQVNQMLEKGVDLKSTNANVTNLLTGSNPVPIEQVNQWMQNGLNLKYAKILLDKNVSIGDINKGLNQYVDTSKGSANWAKQLRNSSINQGISDSLKRWESNGTLNVGNDGAVFNDRPAYSSKLHKAIPPFPEPVIGTLKEYYVNYPGSARIVVDSSGKAFYYPEDPVHYNPDTRIPIPFSYIIKILGG